MVRGMFSLYTSFGVIFSLTILKEAQEMEENVELGKQLEVSLHLFLW